MIKFKITNKNINAFKDIDKETRLFFIEYIRDNGMTELDVDLTPELVSFNDSMLSNYNIEIIEIPFDLEKGVGGRALYVLAALDGGRVGGVRGSALAPEKSYP